MWDWGWGSWGDSWYEEMMEALDEMDAARDWPNACAHAGGAPVSAALPAMLEGSEAEATAGSLTRDGAAGNRLMGAPSGGPKAAAKVPSRGGLPVAPAARGSSSPSPLATACEALVGVRKVTPRVLVGGIRWQSRP